MAQGRVTVVAEIGVNHDGSLVRAFEMIRAAAAAGADWVKFQFFDAAKLAGVGTARYDLLHPLELPYWAMGEFRACAREHGVEFFATPFDEIALAWLVKLGVPAIKIASPDLTNLPFLRAVAQTGLPVILSTGMAWLWEIQAAMRVLAARDVTLLHCTSLYPPAPEELNLRAMQTLAQVFTCPVGLSDHSRGGYAPVAAVALGAVMIEKHFTLDRNVQGPDQAASLEPNEFAEMVRCIRWTEAALGTGEKRPTLRELVIADGLKRVHP